MLQSFVQPVIIREASLCTASSCFFLSTEALSQTASLYSSKVLINEIYNFSKACLLILNFSARNKFSLVQAAIMILLICLCWAQLTQWGYVQRGQFT